MNIFSGFLPGLQLVAQPLNLCLILAGAFLGTLVGALPGIRAIHCVALMLPITYALNLPVATTLIFLLTIYYGCEYGGRIRPIHATSRQKYLRTQLAVTGLCSFCGGVIAIIGLTIVVSLIKLLDIRLGPADYFALTVFAFAALSFRTESSPVKTLISACIGLMLASIGIDSTTGVLRFTMGQAEIYDGIAFTTVVIGLFVVSDVFMLLEESLEKTPPVAPVKVLDVKLNWQQFMVYKWVVLRNALAGFLIGVLPGNGTAVASDLSEKLERQLATRRTGRAQQEQRILLARETANNAAAGGTMVPLLALGIPGSGTSAILLSALLLYNITPGPGLFTQHYDLVWGLIIAAVIGNLVLLPLNIPLIRLFVGATAVPRQILTAGLLALAFVAGFAVHASSFSLLLMVVLGLLGYLFVKWHYPLVPMLLGFVLGELMEDSLRQALAISGGDSTILFAGPISQTFWALSLIAVLLPPAWRYWRGRRR